MDNTFFLPLDTIVLWGKTGETIEVQGNHSESLVTGDRVASETHSERASRRRTALVRKTCSVRTVHWQVARGAAACCIDPGSRSAVFKNIPDTSTL